MDIKKGEEISYNYGYDMDDYEDHPCKCGAKGCIGYIIEESQWCRFRKKLKHRRKKAKLEKKKAYKNKRTC